MRFVAEKKLRDRGHTIPKVDWWCEAATAAADATGLTREQLAAEIARRFNYPVSGTKLIRTLRGDIVTLELAIHVSKLFGIPEPIVVPSSLDEALRFVAQRELERVRAQLGLLSAGVPNTRSADQSGPVKPTDGRRGQRKRGRVERAP